MSYHLNKIKFNLIKSLSCFLFRNLARTWHYHVAGEKHIQDSSEHGFIIVTWHNHQLIPAFYLSDRGYYALASSSEDGGYISNILENAGWHTVRGSSSKNGTRSLIKIMKLLRDKKYIVITPDGPRGPKYTVHAGCIYLAQKTNTPIIPMGIACDQKWTLTKTWDEFIIPKPFAHCAIYFGEPIWIEKELNETQIILERDRIRHALHEVFDKAKYCLHSKAN